MKVLGTATALAPAATKFTLATAVYVLNTSTAGTVTVRNVGDTGNVGTIYVAQNQGITIDLEIGQGLRGAATMFGTQIASSGY